jgi:hypothetical protein
MFIPTENQLISIYPWNIIFVAGKKDTAGKLHWNVIDNRCTSLRRHYPFQVQWVLSQAQTPPLQNTHELREYRSYIEFRLACQRVPLMQMFHPAGHPVCI